MAAIASFNSAVVAVNSHDSAVVAAVAGVLTTRVAAGRLRQSLIFD